MTVHCIKVISRTTLPLALTAFAVACSSDPETMVGLSGGTGGTGNETAGRSGGGRAGGGATAGTGATGGTSGSGGSAAGTGGSGGSAAGRGGGAGTAGGAGAPLGGTGGTGGSGGSAAGSSGVGGVAGRDPSGGAGSGGTAGASGGTAGGASGGGGTGGASPGVPSAGCGKGGRPSGGVVTVSNNHIYTFPTNYDGTTPMPLFMGFHAAGNPIDQIQTLTKGSALETDYVRAFGKSAGNEWVYNTDIAKVLGWYDELMSTYCIDKSRVFAAGHSSGAQMIVQILTKADSAMHMNFKAVAPVAASNYGAITAPIPVMYIQGKMDNVRNSDGADVVARFTTVNGCMSSTMPDTDVASCMRGSMNVTPGCVTYQGCTKPTIWCSHNDPEYSNTNHGWPCFATKAMADFFTALP